jgi:hypothetical protein
MQFASSNISTTPQVSSALVRMVYVALLAASLQAIGAEPQKKAATLQNNDSVPALAIDDTTTPNIVIGFMGGRVQPDNMIHRDAALIDQLQHKLGSHAIVKGYANRDGEAAHAAILHILDRNRDGTVSPDEAGHARIIIYGHSWGASETITLARTLSRDGIPVLLTVQVDSVKKPGEQDDVIPPNVLQAVNVFQRAGLVHGRPAIRAENPEATTILGNFQVSYETRHISCAQYPWYDKMLMHSHLEIESDPLIWDWVEALISSKVVDVPSASPPFPISADQH